MNLINLTGREIVIVNGAGDVIACLPRAGRAARVSIEVRRLGTVSVPGAICDETAPTRANVDVDVVRYEYPEADIVGLPAPVPDTIYVVSWAVLQALHSSGRTDVIAPDTTPGSVIRGAGGAVHGVRRFRRL